MPTTESLPSLTYDRNRRHEFDERIRGAQVDLLYARVPSMVLGLAIAASLLIWTMWEVVSQEVIWGWSACFAGYLGWRAWLYSRFKRTKISLDDADRWLHVWALGSLMSGCLWGAATLLMWVPDSIVHQAFLVGLMFAMTSSGVMLLGAHLPSFYGFMIPTLVPIFVRNVVEGGAMNLALAAVSAIAGIAILSYGHRYNRVIIESWRHLFENEALAGKLKAQNAELEAARAVAETARNEAEIANRSKTQFFAAASHDLRQPLHALGLFAAALSERVKDPEVMRVVNSINASVEALESLFNELLDISKIDAGVIKAAPAHFALRSLFDRLRMDLEPEAADKGLRLRFSPTNAYVFSDQVLIERILRNLISNALRYTRAGGVLVGARKRGRSLSIEVWDTGVGIPQEERERIFEEFYQLGNPERNSKKGLGLGLSIVKRLGGLLGAAVSVDSRPGRGSVFRVRVPLGTAPAPQAARTARAGAIATDLAGARVLVVEDESAVLEGMKVLLEGWGAEVIACTATAEAVAATAALPAAPDLLIVDYRLREGATGTQAIHAVRERFQHEIPAIIVSGSTTPTHLEEAKAMNAHMLLKPVMPAKLRTLISFKLKEASAMRTMQPGGAT
jgi:signal transduction histidine kinase/ActR/RegA family two-component response regulator